MSVVKSDIRRNSWCEGFSDGLPTPCLASQHKDSYLKVPYSYLFGLFVTLLPVCVPVVCTKWNMEKLLTFQSLSTIDDTKTNILAGIRDCFDHCLFSIDEQVPARSWLHWSENQYLGRYLQTSRHLGSFKEISYIIWIWWQLALWPLLVYYWLLIARVTNKELIGKPISWLVSPDIPDHSKRFLISFGFDESWHHCTIASFLLTRKSDRGVDSEKPISWLVSPDIPDHALAIVHNHMEWHCAVVQHGWTP